MEFDASFSDAFWIADGEVEAISYVLGVVSGNVALIGSAPSASTTGNVVAANGVTASFMANTGLGGTVITNLYTTGLMRSSEAPAGTFEADRQVVGTMINTLPRSGEAVIAAVTGIAAPATVSGDAIAVYLVRGAVETAVTMSGAVRVGEAVLATHIATRQLVGDPN